MVSFPSYPAGKIPESSSPKHKQQAHSTRTLFSLPKDPISSSKDSVKVQAVLFSLLTKGLSLRKNKLPSNELARLLACIISQTKLKEK